MEAEADLAAVDGALRATPSLAAPDDAGELYPLDGGVAVPREGADRSAGTVVVVGGAGTGSGAGRTMGGEVTTGGSRTGGGAVVGGGTVGVGVEGTGAGTVGVVTVGTGTVGTGTLGTVTVGTVTVGTGASIAFPVWTNTCAAAKPPTATTRKVNLPNQLTPQTSDQESATTTPATPSEIRVPR